MKRKIIVLLLAFAIVFALCSPGLAVGDGNVDSGEGGGMSTGSKQNFWNNEDGIRISIMKGGIKVACFDWSNLNESSVKASFVRKNKLDYLHGASLTPTATKYINKMPSAKVPTIVGGAGGNNIAAIKRYFTDSNIVSNIATDAGIPYADLIDGDYRLLLEPVAYV